MSSANRPPQRLRVGYTHSLVASTPAAHPNSSAASRVHDSRTACRAHDPRSSGSCHHRVLLRQVDRRAAACSEHLRRLGRDPLENSGNGWANARDEPSRFLGQTPEEGEEPGVAHGTTALPHVEVALVVAHCCTPERLRRARMRSLITACRWFIVVWPEATSSSERLACSSAPRSPRDASARWRSLRTRPIIVLRRSRVSVHWISRAVSRRSTLARASSCSLNRLSHFRRSNIGTVAPLPPHRL